MVRRFAVHPPGIQKCVHIALLRYGDSGSISYRRVTAGFRSAFLVAVLCLLNPCVCMLVAQSAPSDDQPVSTLRVTSHLVQVHFIVQSKNGEPVTDLTKQDFTLLDEGRPQRIAVLSYEGGGQAAPTQPLPPNTFSNRHQPTGQLPGSVTVILLDALNTPFTAQAYARESVVKVLRRLGPDDQVALYILGTKLNVLQDFTQDHAALLRALDGYSGHYSLAQAGSSREPVRTGNSLIDNDKGDGVVANYYLGRRIDLTTQAITAIANHLASVSGPKNLIWLSDSFPVSSSLTRILNQIDMAVYPVDPCGLVAPFHMVSDCPFEPETKIMRGLANLTGGRAFYNTNDVEGSVRTALDDRRSSYTLGYYPDHGKWDGEFREIKLTVNRPDLQVRLRKGYFAMPDGPPGRKDLHAVIEEAFMRPLESSGLSLIANVRPGPQKGEAIFSLNLDAHEMRLDDKAGLWRGSLKVIYRQLDANVRAVSSTEINLGLNLEKSTYDRTLRDGLKITKQVVIAPQTKTLRVLVLDRASGAIGTVSVPVTN
jgi:VWFA-related protein